MNRIKELRKNAGLTQKDLANVVGMSYQAIAAYETGRNEPDFETLSMLADYFCVSIDYLLGRTDQLNSTYFGGMGFTSFDELDTWENSLYDDRPAEKLNIGEHTLLDYYRHLDDNNRLLIIEYVINLLNKQERKKRGIDT